MRQVPERPEPAIIVIFGITGDLAQRKLLPALYNLYNESLLDERTVILGVTRREVTADELLAQVELCVNETEGTCDPESLRKIHAALRMHQMSLVDGDEYDQLLKLMDDIEAGLGVCMNRLYYLSIPPQMFEPIVKNLGSHGLNKSCQHSTAKTRLLVEKPFGYDLNSAQALIEETGEWFHEEQLFRIDHYLAKETVQNILVFRMSNPIFLKLWNAGHVSDILITAYEKLDIEGRATFYDQIGALRDFVQSHLMQLLAVVTMPLPRSLDSQDVHAAKLQLLEAIEPISSDEASTRTFRGQYEGYREEVAKPDSFTETYAEVRLDIASDTWRGVPVTLRTGKAMSERRTDVRITFRSAGAPESEQHVLIFRVTPSDSITLNLEAHSSDVAQKLQKTVQAFNAARVDQYDDHPDAYERVLLDAVRGDHTLFTTSAEVLAAWRVVDDIEKAWSQSDEGLVTYPKGASAVNADGNT